MAISITCECGQLLQIKDEYARESVCCPACQRTIKVPEPDVIELPSEAVQSAPPRPRREERPWLRREHYDDDLDDDEYQLERLPTTRSGKALASLIMGLGSLFLAFLVIPQIVAFVLAIRGLRDILNSRGQLSGQGLAIGGMVTSIVACTLVLPEIEVIKRMRETAAKASSRKNLQEIGVAMQKYHDEHGTLPPAATYSFTGKPLLSWRVALLPHLGHDSLYREFRQNEPWDSPHNKSLLSRMPKVYAAPGKDEDTKTYYRVFQGPGAAFEGQRGLSIPFDFPDGARNTLLVVEADGAVPWTRPEELRFLGAGLSNEELKLPGAALPKLGGIFDSDFHALFADGSVRRFKKGELDDRTLRAFISRNGGEAVPPP